MSENDQKTGSLASAPPSALGQDLAVVRKQRQYELDKQMGRRLSSGKWNLTKLTTRHLHMIGAHLRGNSNKEIAAHIGVHEMTVGRVLRDPLTVRYIEDARENYDLEVKGLIGLAIEAVRDSLRASDTDMRLKGVSSLEKLNKMLHPEQAIIIQDPDDATKIDDAREKFLNIVERLADKFAPILEGKLNPGKSDGSANTDGESEITDIVIEGEGRNIAPAAKDEHVAISGPNAGSSTKGSPS